MMLQRITIHELQQKGFNFQNCTYQTNGDHLLHMILTGKYMLCKAVAVVMGMFTDKTESKYQ